MKLPNALQPLLAALSCLGLFPALHAQVKPETQRDFDCYVQAAEGRMDARKAFVLADSDSSLNEKLVRGQKVETLAPNGPNPHKVAGGQLYDWIGSVFIPGANLEKLIHMLQDYDHRSQYFPETISTSKLLCRSGDSHFRYTMRMKEPAVLDVESDVVWERLDAHRWRCRSYSTGIHEIGKDHGYLRRLNSYWRFLETEKGIFVESETVTLSDEFGGMARTFGSMLLGINPEKSLRHSLNSMRESILKPGLQIPALPTNLAQCPGAARPAACPVAETH
jgi:hypothetical protein